MSVQFAVLASGSRGNSALIQSRGSGILIDIGLGPRVLRDRLLAVGSGWDRIRAVVLTHTHRDHIDFATLRTLAMHGIPFYCHLGHRRGLDESEGYRRLEQVGLAREFDLHPFLLPNGFRIEPVPLRHDSGPTFGFRVEIALERRKRPIALGYLADTGCWTSDMADAVADVDVLGVEFNHDVQLQRTSGRSPHLISRVLGERGHLSNEQGAEFVGEVLARSGRNAVQHLVLLHLSAQCNTPTLALEAANSAVGKAGKRNRVVVHAASQDVSHPNFCIVPPRRAARPLIWHPGPGQTVLDPTPNVRTNATVVPALA